MCYIYCQYLYLVNIVTAKPMVLEINLDKTKYMIIGRRAGNSQDLRLPKSAITLFRL